MPTPKNKSVLKAFAILSAFRATDGWVSSGKLSRRANLPEASGYRHLNTLVELGMVIHGPNGYRPAPGLLALSRNVSVDECLRVASQDILPALAHDLNATVHLTRLEDEMLLYIAKAGTSQSCIVPLNAGSRFEPYSSAPGKLLLSALEPAALEPFLKDELIALTASTITDRALLLSELAAIRCAGFASDNREFHPNISSVALPVRDCEGRVIASLSATECTQRMTAERQKDFRDALARGTDEIADQLFKRQRSVPPTNPFLIQRWGAKEDAEAYA